MTPELRRAGRPPSWRWLRTRLARFLGLHRQNPQLIRSMGSGWAVIPAGPCSGMRLILGPAWPDMLTGRYDQFLYDALAARCISLSGLCVWDVGAHIGYHTLAFARLVGPTGQVVAFEPNPSNRQRLQAHLEANSDAAERIKLSSLALSDRTDTLTMRLSADVDSGASSGSYLDSGCPPSDRYTEETYAQFQRVSVPASTMDELVERCAFRAPQAIKLDVEGAEVEVIRGATATLAACRPLLAIEVHNIRCMFGLHELLNRADYRLTLIDDFDCSSRCFVLATPR